MSDQELLEWAAKAAGYGVGAWFGDRRRHVGHGGWNALEVDADAFRLSVDLRIDITQFTATVRAEAPDIGDFHEPAGSDRYAATRRAITRAAAEIGRASAKDKP